MPYTTEHKQATRARIVESARRLFNRRGLSDVSIDEIMGAAGLTRGGFYNHFASKDELYVEAVALYGKCNPADRWEAVELDFSAEGLTLARQLINAYLSREHLEDVEGHCPLAALPSDIARAGPEVKAAYEKALRSLAALLDAAPPGLSADARRKRALSLVALCVGGMVLARTLTDAELANDIREAARELALEVAG